MSNEEDTYTFVVEWFDSVADLTRKYNLTYWPKDGSLSMYDLTKNRLFLKRVVNKDVSFPNDLYIGKTIVVYSRQLKVVGYSDKFTQSKFQAISNAYNVLFMDFKSFTRFVAQLNTHKSPFHFKSIRSVTANRHLQQMLGLQKENGMLILCEFVGSTHIESALKECKNQDFNARICDESKDEALLTSIAQSDSSANLSPSAVSSLCVIKPHALPSAPSIMEDILSEGFHITAVTTKKVTLSEAKDFYEVYNGVVKEYSYLIEQLLAGSVIALQIECNSDNKENAQNKQQSQSAVSGDMDAAIANSTFNEFREFVGPKDPEIAKYIRPHTLRAKYGADRVQNGVHCTDLQEDGVLESRFFFQIVQ